MGITLGDNDFKKATDCCLFEHLLLVGNLYASPVRLLSKSDAYNLRKDISSTRGQSRRQCDFTGFSSKEILFSADDLYMMKSHRFSKVYINIDNTDVKLNSLFSPHPDYVLGLKAYNNIYVKLNNITQGSKENNQKLARIFIELAKTGKFNSSILSEMLPDKNAAELKSLKDFITKVYYLFIVHEVIRRPEYKHSVGYLRKRDDKINPSNLSRESVMITQVMSLILLEEGAIDLKEIFSNDAEYSLATGKKLRDKSNGIFKDKALNIYNKFTEHFGKQGYRLSAQGLCKMLNYVLSPEETSKHAPPTPGNISETPRRKGIKPGGFYAHKDELNKFSKKLKMC